MKETRNEDRKRSVNYNSRPNSPKSDELCLANGWDFLEYFWPNATFIATVFTRVTERESTKLCYMFESGHFSNWSSRIWGSPTLER